MKKKLVKRSGDNLGYLPSRSIRHLSPSTLLFKYFSPNSQLPHHPPNPKFPHSFKLHSIPKSVFVANHQRLSHSTNHCTYILRTIPISSPNLPKSRIRTSFSPDLNPFYRSKGDSPTKFNSHPNIRSNQAKFSSLIRSPQAKDKFLSQAHKGIRQNLRVQLSGNLVSTEGKQFASGSKVPPAFNNRHSYFRPPLPSQKNGYADAVSRGLAKPPFQKFNNNRISQNSYSTYGIIKCFKCGGLDHLIKDCRKLLQLCFKCGRSGRTAKFCGIFNIRRADPISKFSYLQNKSCTDTNLPTKGFSFRSKQGNLVSQSFASLQSLFLHNPVVIAPKSNSCSRKQKSFWRKSGTLMSKSSSQADILRPIEDAIMDNLMEEGEVQETLVNPRGVNTINTSNHSFEVAKEGSILDSKAGEGSLTLQGNGERFSMQNDINIASISHPSFYLHRDRSQDLVEIFVQRQYDKDSSVHELENLNRNQDNDLARDQTKKPQINRESIHDLTLKVKFITGTVENGALICFTTSNTLHSDGLHYLNQGECPKEDLGAKGKGLDVVSQIACFSSGDQDKTSFLSLCNSVDQSLISLFKTKVTNQTLQEWLTCLQKISLEWFK